MILTYFNFTLCSLCTGHSSPDGAIIVQDNRKELFVTTPPQLTSDTSGSASPPTVRSLTDLPSQHSQVSLFSICVNNIHRSVTHQTTLTTFMGKSLTHQSSQHSQIQGVARDASPGSPNSFIFMQFSAKNLRNNSNFGSWCTPGTIFTGSVTAL